MGRRESLAAMNGRFRNALGRMRNSRVGEGLRTAASTVRASGLRAGVRKPPKDERAGVASRYGDLAGGSSARRRCGLCGLANPWLDEASRRSAGAAIARFAVDAGGPMLLSRARFGRCRAPWGRACPMAEAASLRPCVGFGRAGSRRPRPALHRLGGGARARATSPKVSITSMRPPQQGHGVRRSAAEAGLGVWGGAGTASSSRARAMLALHRPVASRP